MNGLYGMKDKEEARNEALLRLKGFKVVGSMPLSPRFRRNEGGWATWCNASSPGSGLCRRGNASMSSFTSLKRRSNSSWSALKAARQVERPRAWSLDRAAARGSMPLAPA